MDSFSADGKQLSVNDFLEKFSELHLARGFSAQGLFGPAIDLFADKALTCYQANRCRFNNWKTLSELLC